MTPLHDQDRYPAPTHWMDYDEAAAASKPTTEQLRDAAENAYWEARCARDEGAPYAEVKRLEREATEARERWASSTGRAA